MQMNNVFGRIIRWCAIQAGKVCLYVDRKVLKRYLNIETPTYKLWWNVHCVKMQKALDAEHNPYRNFTM